MTAALLIAVGIWVLCIAIADYRRTLRIRSRRAKSIEMENDQ